MPYSLHIQWLVFTCNQQVYDVVLLSPPQDKDIYLLDDPLAAVDTDVAEHLMKKCILELLRGKTRILCTHRVEFVDKADLVVLMDNGTIIETGRNRNVAQAQSHVVIVIRLQCFHDLSFLKNCGYEPYKVAPRWCLPSKSGKFIVYH